MTRIVVVDDEGDIVTIVKKSLGRAGFDVDGFTDPNLALKNIKVGKYDMLITDIRMPQMNGFELYREAKKIDQNIKVAFLTAFEIYRDEFTKILPSTNVSLFLKKPVRMIEVVERVKRELTITSSTNG